MNEAILVAIPVLNRPARVGPLLASLEAARGQVPYRPLFVLSPGDDAEREAVEAAPTDYLTVPWEPGPGDFAKKINYAFAETVEPWIFAAADDLLFHPGWADEAFTVSARTQKGVIGTNDLGNSRVIAGHHSTHTLFARWYVERYGTIDESGKIYCENYDHVFCDDEAVATALIRKQFAFARDSVVEHLHPCWGKGENDATYEKGQRHFWDDKKLFEERSALWLGRVRIHQRPEPPAILHDPYAPPNVRTWP